MAKKRKTAKAKPPIIPARVSRAPQAGKGTPQDHPLNSAIAAGGGSKLGPSPIHGKHKRGVGR